MDFKGVLLAIFQARTQVAIFRGDERGISLGERAQERYIDDSIEGDKLENRAY